MTNDELDRAQRFAEAIAPAIEAAATVTMGLPPAYFDALQEIKPPIDPQSLRQMAVVCQAAAAEIEKIRKL